MTLYVYQLNENTLITHDGYTQLGICNSTLEDFLDKAQTEYTQTYWLPDVFVNRYKRANYQKHIQSASIGTKTEKL